MSYQNRLLGIMVRPQPLAHLPATLPFSFTTGLVGPTADGKWEKASQETQVRLGARTHKLPATTFEQLVALNVLSQGFTGHKKGCGPVPPCYPSLVRASPAVNKFSSPHKTVSAPRGRSSAALHSLQGAGGTVSSGRARTLEAPLILTIFGLGLLWVTITSSG